MPVKDTVSATVSYVARTSPLTDDLSPSGPERQWLIEDMQDCAASTLVFATLYDQGIGSKDEQSYFFK